MRTDFPYDAIDALTFTPQSRPISANLRPFYRVAMLTLVIRLNCRGGKASLLKLQFFNWMLKSSEVRDHVERLAKTQNVFTLHFVHMDPLVNLALRYAFAENLVQVHTNSKYSLTEKGEAFADTLLEEDPPVLGAEQEFLIHIGKNITEVKLQRDLGAV